MDDATDAADALAPLDRGLRGVETLMVERTRPTSFETLFDEMDGHFPAHHRYCGDTVLTPVVAETIVTLKPDIVVVPAGGARLDIGRPILMTPDDVIRCITLAPDRVVALHMEALNHCPTTRQTIRQRAEQAGLIHKVLIPDDGAVLQL